MTDQPDYLNERCGKCGLTLGAHHGGSYNPDPPCPPHDYCPGHEGWMDWDEGPGTTFEPTGIFIERKYGKAAENK